ncbi:Uncharacterised protein [Dermatophilus congolensis]|uniref:DUF732 domain-containing protein n=2 Tax=Dermatophilus congolensis TaxID=1863 RepID=A0A239VTR4_9MICO|nr:Uncharacterised protein [Dermatophilus congolensis]
MHTTSTTTRNGDNPMTPHARPHRSKTPLAIAAAALLLTTACAAPHEAGPVPPLPSAISSAAASTIAQLPPPPANSNEKNTKARHTITAFADAAQRALITPNPPQANQCHDAAELIDKAATPQELLTAAVTLNDPDLRSLTLAARTHIGTYLSRCAAGNPPSPQAAHNALALLRARLDTTARTGEK